LNRSVLSVRVNPRELKPGRTLSNTERVGLRRPFQRQVDTVEQGFGAELGGLLSLADRFPEGGCDEGQALSRAWWSFIA
jgi:hypothetical protein